MKRTIFTMLMVGLVVHLATAQCGKFADSPEGDEGLKNHSLYRELVKQDQYKEAFPYWEKAYKIAPAADGNRHYHYSDGIKIYKYFLENTEDEAKKGEYRKAIVRLYDERIACYGNEGEVLGRKASDMLYLLESSPADMYKAAKRSVELEGKNTGYYVLFPLANSAVELYKKGELPADEAREVFKQLNDIADDNISNLEKEKYKEYFKTVKTQVNQKFDEVARGGNGKPALFDCAYFIKKERPKYEANPNDNQVVEDILGRLAAYGCDESDAFYAKLYGQYKGVLIAQNEEIRRKREEEERARITDEKEGVEAQKAGNNTKAIGHYKDAMNDSSLSAEAHARVGMRLAKLYYQIGQKSSARTYARKAASYRSGWAEPYLLIGNLYASSGKDCGSGTGFESQRVVWAAIDQWEKAISVEPGSEDAREARNQINKYTQYMPTKEDLHMQGLKKGDSYTVPCWINETTTIRFDKKM